MKTKEMTDQELNRALAVALGWTLSKSRFGRNHGLAPVANGIEPIPNYAGDLNAVHTVALSLVGIPYIDYRKKLTRLVGIANSQRDAKCIYSEDATARQRAEALLEVLG